MRVTESSDLKWQIVEAHVCELAELQPDWNSYGASPVPPELIETALHLVTALRRSDSLPPMDVYALPDGHPLFEWQFPNGIIANIEVEAVGRGEFMISYPDNGMPAEFDTVSWSSDEPLTYSHNASGNPLLVCG